MKEVSRMAEIKLIYGSLIHRDMPSHHFLIELPLKVLQLVSTVSGKVTEKGGA